MAVTAHWIQSIIEDLPTGPKQKLQLRADLIGFHRIPGHHHGEHLAHCFLFITDRVHVTEKVHRILMFFIHLLIQFDRLVGLQQIMLAIMTP